MNIEFAQFVNDSMMGERICVTAVIDGSEINVPLDPKNRHYAEILRQVEAGTLVIQEADNV